MGGNMFLIMIVIGALLGFGGRGVLSNLNPFKAGRVAVVKQESHKEEYFKDKVKGIEYRMKQSNESQAPAKKTFGQSIGSFIDKSMKIIVLGIIASVVLSTNLFAHFFKYVKKLKSTLLRKDKALRQTIVGIQEAKIQMNGEKDILLKELKDKQDEDTKLLIKEIKLGKTEE